MGEGGAFGVAGRATRILDVDRVVELLFRLQLRQGLRRDTLGPCQDVAPVPHARDPLLTLRPTQPHHVAELRKSRGLQLAGSRVFQLGTERLEHRDVVAGAELGRHDQHAATGLIERILELLEAVGRVDVDENGADLGRGKLRNRPLSPVGCPDAHPLPPLETKGHQAAGTPVDLLPQLSIGVAEPLVAHNQRLMIREAGDRLVEGIADREPEQGLVACAAGVARDPIHRVLPHGGSRVGLLHDGAVHGGLLRFR